MSVVVRLRRLAGKHNKLENMAKNIVSETQDAMNQQILAAVDVMQSEPPEKLGSQYVRTHRYADSWQPIFARPSGGRLEGGIRGNAVDERGHNYTVYVGGDSHGEGQQQQHFETGWPLAVDALEGRVSNSGVRLVPFGERIRQAVHRSIEES